MHFIVQIHVFIGYLRKYETGLSIYVDDAHQLPCLVYPVNATSLVVRDLFHDRLLVIFLVCILILSNILDFCIGGLNTCSLNLAVYLLTLDFFKSRGGTHGDPYKWS